MTGMDFSPFKLQIYGLHKSLGIVVLVLGVFRLGWRFLRQPPEHLETHTRLERVLSRLIHFVLYGVLFAMPLSGWAMSSAGDFPNSFFGVFEMPDLVGKDEALFKRLRQVHSVVAYVIVGAVGLHMAGAAKHHFIDRDGTLARMSRDGLGLVGGALTVLFFGGMLMMSVVQIGQDFAQRQSAGEVAFEGAARADIQAEESAQIEEAARWVIAPDVSFIHFSATQYGQAFEGKFARFDGDIVFDPDDLERSSVRIKIDVASIATGSDDRDAQALGPEWFDTGAYPVAVFEVQRFGRVGAGYEAIGTLSIRGQVVDFTLPFSLEIKGERAVMEAQVSLNRMHFGVGSGQWADGQAIGLDVDLIIRVEASQSH